MDAKDRLIEKQAAQIDAQREYIRVLEQKIKLLEEKIARLEKDSDNSSKPPSSDIVKPKKAPRKRSRKKRNKGGQHGHHKFSRTPFKSEEIDETIEYEFKAKDAVGLKPLDEWSVIQQIELPEKMYKVIEHRARKYLDPLTGRIHIAPIPDEIRKGGLFGADVSSAVAFMKGGCHMSYSTIQQFFKEVIGLKVSRGMLAKVTQKISASLEASYNKLVKRLPYESYLGIDETGHKDEGKKYWTWCFQTPSYTLFHIDESRGSRVLLDLLSDDFTGIIGCDYWGGYRKFSRLSDAPVQYCMAHLIREIRFAAGHTSKTLSRWANDLLQWLKKLFDTLNRSHELTDRYFAKKIEEIKTGFLKRMRRPPGHELAQKLARRFKGKAAENYFRFMTDPDIEPTNNGTEREIRHTVIDRRITQGTRGRPGMQWCQRIWTTIATCKKQNRNVFEFIHNSLLAHWTNNCCPELV
jgi:transposase